MIPPRAALSICSRKSFSGWFFVAMMLGFVAHAAAQDNLKVAVVDVARVFKEYAKVAELDSKIEEARQIYENEVNNRMEGHHRLVEELARLNSILEKSALPADEKADLVKKREANLEETRKLEGEIRDFRIGRERAIQELTVRARTQIVEEILVVVNARVENRHYDLVLNRSGQSPGGRPMVVYANGSLDITDDVVATLNQTHPVVKPTVPAGSP